MLSNTWRLIYCRLVSAHAVFIQQLTMMGDSKFRQVLCLFCAFLAVAIAVADEYRTVNTKYGPIRGVRKTSLLKKIDFYSFKGIPYAKPPIDDLRFKVCSSCSFLCSMNSLGER